jgi:hypothetical protein
MYIFRKTGFPSYVASRDSNISSVKTGRGDDVIGMDGDALKAIFVTSEVV